MTKLWNIIYMFVLFNSDKAFSLMLPNTDIDFVEYCEHEEDDEDGGNDEVRPSKNLSILTRIKEV